MRINVGTSLRRDAGLGRLEWLGIAAAVAGLAVFVPPLRGAIGDFYEWAIWGNQFRRGLLIGIGSFVIFGGTVYLLLWTNVGTRLGFLISGAALTGFAALNGLLFVLYSPRGPRPADIEGLNAFQIRIMPGAMMVGSAILFAMFLVALSRLEAADKEESS